MCGRYYMDDETVEEIEKVIRLVDAKVHNRADITMLQTGDIHPADLAPVIAGRNHEIQLEKIRWGIPKDDKLIINARTETVLEKRCLRTAWNAGGLLFRRQGFMSGMPKKRNTPSGRRTNPSCGLPDFITWNRMKTVLSLLQQQPMRLCNRYTTGCL